MLDLLAEIYSSLAVLSSILGAWDWPPYSLLVVSSWNRYKVRIVSCIAELLQILGLAFLKLFVQLSMLLLSRFLHAPGFLWGPHSRARLSLPNGFLCMSIPAVATRLLTTHRRPISLIHFPSSMSVKICWAIGCMIASSFDWMRGICLGWIFPPWSLIFGFLGLTPKGLDSSIVAHRVCTISAHDRSHTVLTLYSSALAFRPYHYWKNSIWCGQVLHFWYHHVMHHPSDLCVCVPQIESVILRFFESNLETDHLLSQTKTLSRWNILYATLPHSAPLPWLHRRPSDLFISAWIWVFTRLWRSGCLAVGIDVNNANTLSLMRHCIKPQNASMGHVFQRLFFSGFMSIHNPCLGVKHTFVQKGDYCDMHSSVIVSITWHLVTVRICY